MAFDLSGDAISTFLGVNDAPREPAPSKPGNGAHVIQQHNSLVANAQSVLNSLGQSVDSFRSQTSDELMAMGNRIAELGATISSAAPAPQAPFLMTGNYIASSGEKIIFYDYYTDTPITLFLPFNPPIGTEVSLMHLNPDQPIWIKNENQGIFPFRGSPTYEIHLVPAYEMASLVYIGLISRAQIDYGWLPTSNTAFIQP